MVVDENMDLLLFQEQFKNEKDCHQRMLYKCMKCGKQISITAGTIFHKTKTPLLKWFWLIFRMATSKTGVSIAEMQRELGIKDYKTIWTMAHKIRKAMADRDAQYKLAGLVELDESFLDRLPKGREDGEQRIRDWSLLRFLFR